MMVSLFRAFGRTVLRLVFILLPVPFSLSAGSADRVCDSFPEDPVPVLEPEGEPDARLFEFGKIFSERIAGKTATPEDRARLFALLESDPDSESLLPFVIASLGNPPAASKDFPRLEQLARKVPSATLLNLTLGELLLADKEKETEEEKEVRLDRAYEFLHAAYQSLASMENAPSLDRKTRYVFVKYMMVCLLQKKDADLLKTVRYLKSVPAYYADPELSAVTLLMILGRMEKVRPVSLLPLSGPIPDKAFTLRCAFSEAFSHFLKLLEEGRFTESRPPGQLAVILTRMGKTEDLRRALLSWILLTGGTRPEPLEFLAAVEETAGRGMTAGRLVELSLASGKPADPTRMIFAAVNTYRNAGAPERALALLKKYGSRIRDKGALTDHYIQLHLMLHDIPSALKAAASLPESHAKYIQIMLIQKDMKQWKAAAAAGRKALSLIRKNKLKLTSNAFYLIYAEILEKTGDVDSLRAVLEPLIRENPEDPDLLNFLGYVLADHDRDLDYAQDLIKRALKKKPENGAILDSMAWVLFRKGRFQEAKTFMLQSLERCGETPDATILDHAGDIFHALGEKKTAADFWQRALRLLEETGEDPDLEKSVRKKCRPASK